MHEIIDCIIAYLTSNEQKFPLTKSIILYIIPLRDEQNVDSISTSFDGKNTSLL